MSVVSAIKYLFEFHLLISACAYVLFVSTLRIHKLHNFPSNRNAKSLIILLLQMHGFLSLGVISRMFRENTFKGYMYSVYYCIISAQHSIFQKISYSNNFLTKIP